MSSTLTWWLVEGRRRWSPVATVVPYLLLAVLAGFTVIAKWGTGGALAVDLGLCALTAVWVLVLFTLRPAWRDRPVVMAVPRAAVTAASG